MSGFRRATDAFRRAVTNKYSSFYRDLYQGCVPTDTKFPSTHEEWRTIPFLTKKEIMRFPLKERIFIPISDLSYLRCTSGTSSMGIIVIPRGKLPQTLPNNPPVQGLNLATPFYHTNLLAQSDDGRRSRIIATDRGELPVTAALLKQIGADSLLGPPSFFIALGNFLRTIDAHINILHLQLSAEHCSELQRQTLHTLYPNAHISIVYASAETHVLASSPRIPVPDHPNAIEIFPGYYIEIIDTEGKATLELGVEGELVVTNLSETLAFPLIRYKTGDIAAWVKKPDQRALIDIGSRVTDDRIRIDGGEIYFKEMERAILDLKLEYIVDFEAVVSEEMKDARPIPKLSIMLIVSEMEENSEVLKIAEYISHNLRVNQLRTYEDGVAQGMYAPLQCTFAPAQELGAKKRRHLVDTRM